LVTERESGAYVEPSKQTVARYFQEWLRDWAPAKAGPKTLDGYRQWGRHLCAALGDLPLQRVRGGDLMRMYRELADKNRKPRPLSPRSIKHLHVLTCRLFRHAVRQGDIKVDPSKQIDAPSVPRTEAPVLKAEEIPIMLNGLRGSVFYPIAVVALGTGMRRGELCGLRWCDVDLEGGKLKVVQSIEQTQRGELRIKPPKSAAGRRTISLSPSIVAVLQERRREQLELRLKLGMGKPPADELVFAS